MKIIADFHIHSKYSRAVSRDMTPENLGIWAQKKGITVMGTGDFTHPKWREELKEKLEPAEEGLYTLKFPIQNVKTRFLLTVEIAVIYSKGGKVRRIHHLVFVPSFSVAEKINKKLSKIGNLVADGRPMLGLDSKALLEIVKDADPAAVLIPAHAWTPWFSVFGSMSGFNSLAECFEELTPDIFAIETGLSSDPLMNWRVPFLDNIALISNSDSHSLRKIGREANVFDCELSYSDIIDAIKSRNPKKFLQTTEFFPEEGKYHYDGHRDLHHAQHPEETKKAGGRCAQCGAKVTIGVLSRVEELAGQSPPFNNRPRLTSNGGQIPYKSLIPLEEVIADVYGVGVASKRVQNMYNAFIERFGSEFGVLLDAPLEDLARFSPEIAEGIECVREGRVTVAPGYDGEYGKAAIHMHNRQKEKQQKLF